MWVYATLPHPNYSIERTINTLTTTIIHPCHSQQTKIYHLHKNTYFTIRFPDVFTMKLTMTLYQSSGVLGGRVAFGMLVVVSGWWWQWWRQRRGRICCTHEKQFISDIYHLWKSFDSLMWHRITKESLNSYNMCVCAYFLIKWKKIQ